MFIECVSWDFVQSGDQEENGTVHRSTADWYLQPEGEPFPCWLRMELATEVVLRYQNHWRGCWHLWFKEGVDPTRNFFHLVVGTFLRTEMTNVKQSTVFATCAVSSWFSLHVQCCAFSWEDKADSDKNQTVIQLKACKNILRGGEVVPFFCEAIEKEEKLSIAPSKIVSRQEARRCLRQQLLC